MSAGARLFDRIASSYDLVNDLMTFGLHRLWRKRAASFTKLCPGDWALDVCCGTGDFAFELKKLVGPSGRVVGIDVSSQMLLLARRKMNRHGLEVDLKEADVLALPYAEDTFAACTVGFGLRNVSDVAKALSEMARVCRPGGRIVCLELTPPRGRLAKVLFDIWLDKVVPILGQLAAGDYAAYKYLPESVLSFPSAEELVLLMQAAGLCEVKYQLVGGGLVAIHWGTVA